MATHLWITWLSPKPRTESAGCRRETGGRPCKVPLPPPPPDPRASCARHRRRPSKSQERPQVEAST
eukprot:14127577-Alexandrium_andersonii.AAC.1